MWNLLKRPGTIALPRRCFISHAYADAGARERLIQALPPNVEPFVFQPIRVAPDQFVSTPLIEAVLACDGLIYLRGGASDRSFWVALERDYARRARKRVFHCDADTIEIAADSGRPLDLEVFAAYAREQREEVRAVADLMSRDRHFDVWLDVESLESGQNWQKTIEQAVEERARQGYVIVFWSRAASRSLALRAELERAAGGMGNFNDRVLFALLEPCEIPEFWLRFNEPAVQLYGDAERSHTQRIDDLVVRLYWLIYRKTTKL